MIQAHLQQIPDIELVATFSNPMEAIKILKDDAIDLIFLDIEMPLLSGIDFVKTLKNPPKIIFTTAYRNYAIESYELDVVDYLLKPIAFSRFFKAINKYRSLVSKTSSEHQTNDHDTVHDYIYVNSNKKFIKIQFGIF